MPNDKHNHNVTIRPARKDDLPEAIELLAHVFAEDRAVRSILAYASDHDPVDFARAIYEIQVYGHYFERGKIDLAVEGDKIYGVGLWAKPGEQMSTARFVRLLPRYVKLFGRASAFVARREARAEAAHPPFPHWYTFALGVSPDAQGLGVGSTLLRHGLQRAGNSPVYLEASTPKSAALYRSFGFVELGEIDIPGDKLSDPPEIAMWREPAEPASAAYANESK